MKSRASYFGRLLLPAAAIISFSGSAQAADQTWSGTTDGSWATGTNWSGNAVPGGATGVSSGDTATFNSSVNTTVTVDATRNIKNILFDTGAGAFTFGGGILVFTNAGAITMNAGVANTETINSNILLSTTASSTYSFINNSSTVGANLNITGNVTGQTTATPETLTLGGSSGGTISGVIGNGTLGGTVALTKSGAGTWTLSGANTYTGTTAVTAGTLKIGNASALGGSRVNLTAGATLDLNGSNLGVAFINNGAALAGGVIDNVSAGGNVTLTVGSGLGGVSAASGTYTNIDTFSGVIQNTTGTVGLTKVSPTLANQSASIMATASLLTGPNVLRLTNNNTYTGATTIKGGVIELAFNISNNGGTAVTSNIISATSALVLAGGDLINDTNVALGGGTQTFASLTLNAGASHIGTYRRASGSATTNLNLITRNVGGVIDFQSRPSGASSNAKLGDGDGTNNTKTANANFSGGGATILGGWAVFNQNTWAVSAGNGTTSGAISGLATGSYNTSFTATANVDAAIGTSTPAAMTINSLRFNNAGVYSIDTSGNLNIATGGILVTTGVGANAVSINNNNLTSGNGQDLIVTQNNSAGGMTITSNITGTTGLTKSGIGSLTLAPNAANSFTGQLSINTGALILGNANALNSNGSTYNDVVFGGTSQINGTSSGANYVFQNGTLTLNGFNATVASLASSADSSGTAIVQNASGSSAATLTVNGTTSTNFAGILQDGTGGNALSLTKSGSSTLTLSGASTYTGATTVSNGSLTVGVNNAIGSSSNVIVSGGTLAVGSFNDTVAGLQLASGSITGSTGVLTSTSAFDLRNGSVSAILGGSAGLNKSTADSVTLSAANTYSGTTAISGGSLGLSNSLALQNSTLNYNNQGGSLSFGTLTSATLGGLSGAQNMVLTNTTPSAVALTVGGNGVSTTYSGELSGLGSLTKSGSGTLTLTGSSSFAGSTNVLAGTLLLNTGGTINGGTIGATGLFNVNGGSLTSTGTSTIIGGNTTGFLLSSGSASFGTIQSQTNDGALIKVAGGSFSATTVTLQRTGNPGQTNAPATSGFVVTGGTASISENLKVGTSNSSATALVNGGSLTIAGTANVGNTTNSRWSTLQVSSGSLDVTGSDGVQLSTNSTVANNSQLLLTGGITTVEAIKYGAAASLANSRGDVVVNNGAALYVGSGGVSVVSGNAYTANFSVTGATLGAKANWSTSVPIALSGNATIKAADVSDASFNINLNGQLSGFGANLIKTGGGTLTLGAANSYTGTTAVSSGTFALGANGSIANSTSIRVASGATLDVSAVTGGWTVGATTAQTLTGSGGVTGATTIGALGSHNAGDAAVNSGVGSQAFSSNLTYASNSIFNWDINANSNVSGFDTVSAGGSIDVSTTGTVFNVIFGTGVDLANAFWSTPDTTQTWSMASIFGQAFTSGSFANVTSTADPVTQGSFSITGSTLTWSAVPEPTSALVGLLIGAGLLRRRRALT